MPWDRVYEVSVIGQLERNWWYENFDELTAKVEHRVQPISDFLDGDAR